MSAVPKDEPRAPEQDQRVTLHLSWDDFERFLDIRGGAAGPRLTYLEGELELMSPSREHERIKKALARLLEAYAEEKGIRLDGYGSWTIKSVSKRRAVEPDECYVIGAERDDEERTPDLAIEVIWTHGGLDKLDVYAGLGVREVWLWRDGALEVQRLAGERYQRVGESEVLPGLDLDAMARHAELPDQTQAVRDWRAYLQDG
jgi:Uma2 family endonuclease